MFYKTGDAPVQSVLVPCPQCGALNKPGERCQNPHAPSKAEPAPPPPAK